MEVEGEYIEFVFEIELEPLKKKVLKVMEEQQKRNKKPNVWDGSDSLPYWGYHCRSGVVVLEVVAIFQSY
jgi:hypothetical protein